MSDAWDRITALEVKIENKELPHLSAGKCWALHRFIEHGSKEHREWLIEAILAWSLGKKRPDERN